ALPICCFPLWVSPLSRSVVLKVLFSTFLPSREDLTRAEAAHVCRIVVAVQFGPTVWTRMPALPELFGDDAATAGTRLRGVLGGNFHDLATSLFRFVATERDKLSPACISNGLVEATLSGGSV